MLPSKIQIIFNSNSTTK